MKTVKIQIPATLLLFLTVYLTCSFLFPTPLFGIRINVSSSLPFKLFFSAPFRTLMKNRYVSIEHSSSSILVAKQLIGVPGDIVAIREGHIYVNDQNYGCILQQSPSGIPLTPLSEEIIPEGYVFVYASHKEGSGAKTDFWKFSVL